MSIFPTTIFDWVLQGLITLLFVGVFWVVLRFGQSNSKTEADIPEGCELVKIGDNYAFKIGDRFADLETTCYTWVKPYHIQTYCLTRSKTKAIKRGIDCYELFKATNYMR